MKIKKITKEYFTDSTIGLKIREFGARRLAGRMGIAPSYLSMCLHGETILSERYEEICKIVGHEYRNLS